MAAQKKALEASVGAGYRVIWIEGSRKRWQMARLLFRSAYIRLTTREAWEVHRKTIEWGAQFSDDRLPDQAIGVDAVTLKIMKRVLRRWERVQFLNRYLAGTWPPRLQMDLLPGYRCAAHFLIVADKPLETIDDYIAGGRAVQRFWLTATSLALQFQPEMTPLIFVRYGERSMPFTVERGVDAVVRRIWADLRKLFVSTEPAHGVFLGRVGVGALPRARSLRMVLRNLMTGSSTGSA